MKKLLSIAFVALTVSACSEEVIKRQVPDPGPGDGTQNPGTDPGTTDPGTNPATDSCACPATCKSTADAKMVCHPAAAPADLEVLKGGGFTSSGFEYWQWKKDDPYNDGKNVAWGYNGDGQPKTGVMPTDAAKKCMAEAHKVLEKILSTDIPPELTAFKAKYKITTFWEWNNDMTDAKKGVEVPDQYQSLWLYDTRLIKWMSHTERDGSCRLPSRDDLVKFAKGCMAEMDHYAGQSKGCYNSSF